MGMHLATPARCPVALCSVVSCPIQFVTQQPAACCPACARAAGSPLVKDDKSLAQLLPELAERLRAANLTSA